MKSNNLLDCGHPASEHSNFTTGYGEDPKTGKKFCYACCAERDKDDMRKTGHATLYLTEKGITNWPGSLILTPYFRKTGLHNIARIRRDVWFMFERTRWHGVNYGNFSQILHCKRIK